MVLHEITERVRMERALREQAAFTQALVDLAQEALSAPGLEALAAAIARRLQVLFGAEEALVGMAEAELRLLYATRPLEGPLPRPNLLERALEEGKPLVLETLAEGSCALAEAWGLRSALVIPFRAQGFLSLIHISEPTRPY